MGRRSGRRAGRTAATTTSAAAAAEVAEVVAAEQVAAERPESLACQYAVDAFRLPIVDETGLDLVDWARRMPSEWMVVDQQGDCARHFAGNWGVG
ncbi:hypothetical protein [Streptomyces sp. GS7]|uniref:hypothetical protein n=1 Tax=Streptomyces sp. GS7 TaxID=2692234 RepID=UPI0013165106|nr:hypothetical protein [Streptomyces sp. GS7]QHC23193.1 hypothetical protein GR130_19035 [Streptomyces sp. GS7]